MPLTSSLLPWYIKKFLGMNNKVEDNELSIEQSILTQNGRFENDPGALVKRDALSYYNDTELATSSQVQSAFRFYNSSGDAKIVAASGTKLYVGDDTTGVMTEIKSGLTDGKKFGHVVYKNLLILGNAFDPTLVYDGSDDNVVWELGACKAVDSGNAGNPNGVYYYAVTMDNDAYVTDAVSNSVTVVTNQISLTNIPLGPSGTVNRKIYRTTAGGSSLLLLTTIANNTATTYTDNVADGSLGAAMPAVTDPMPKGNILQMHRERLFIAGDVTYPSRIFYSNVYLPWFIQQYTNNDFLDIFPDDGDEIQGIPVLLDVMCCIKRNTIRKVFITNATQGAGPDSWYASDIVSYTGSPAKWSITKTPYGIAFLGWDHWELFDGSATSEIIDEFDSYLDVFQADYRNTVAHWHNGILYATYTNAEPGAQYKDRLMVYNWRRKALAVDNVNVECFSSFSGGDDTNELFYGASDLGFVYQAARAEKVVRWRTQSDFSGSTYADAYLGGEEDDPFLSIGWDLTIDELINPGHSEAFTGGVGDTINDLIGTIDMMDTTGTVTFPSQNLSVGTFGRLYWNLMKFHASDTAQFYVRTGATQAATEAAAWVGPYSEPNGSNILATANLWFQMKVDMTANSTAGSPKIFFEDGFVIKLTYTKGGNPAEDSVEFIHDTGFRNFDAPMVDKIFKKITLNHLASGGDLRVDWETEFSSGSFTIDLTANPQRWESFFPDNAFGRKLRLTFYKNDLEDLKIKEAQGLYTPEPTII